MPLPPPRLNYYGYHKNVSLSCLLLDFRKGNNLLMKAIPLPRQESDQEVVDTAPEDIDVFSEACHLRLARMKSS